METVFDADLIRRYDGRGPRYTSYPTALQFTESFSDNDYLRHALASNESDTPLSLYLHIPFCHSLCYYCGCNKIITRNQERVQRYLGYLHREIDLQADIFDGSRQVEQLHFGGGTPTYLDERQLAELMNKLDRAFGLDHGAMHEFSIEVDPRTANTQRIHELARLGFNRLSLGVQDFDPDVQRAVNREQSVAEVTEITSAARSCGFRSLSFDLIYGLPRQNVASFDETLDRVIEMKPDRLAVYNYAHLPERFKGQRMIDAQHIPTPETKLLLLQHTIEKLGDAGYVYVGMDHFALPDDDLVVAQEQGRLQRNFQGYSTHRHCDLIGLGMSSIGNVNQCFAQNAPTTMQYEALLDANRLPVVKGISVDTNDQLRAAVIQELMCYDVLDFATFDTRHGCNFRQDFAVEIDCLQALAEDGLLEISADRIAITGKGRLLLRNIAMTFDRHTGDATDNRRFSRAI